MHIVIGDADAGAPDLVVLDLVKRVAEVEDDEGARGRRRRSTINTRRLDDDEGALDSEPKGASARGRVGVPSLSARRRSTAAPAALPFLGGAPSAALHRGGTCLPTPL